MSAIAWAVVIAIFLVIEGYLGWRLTTAFTRGVVIVDPLFWLLDWIGLECTISRARHPIFYGLGVLLLIVVFIIVLALFVTVVAVNLKGS